MPRWIAFDQQTSALLRSNLAHGATIETFGRGPVDYALAKPGSVITLLPPAGGTAVGIAVFRPPSKKAAVRQIPAEPPRHGTIRATGFLGLSDESVVEEEQTEEKKGWWKKFWEE